MALPKIRKYPIQAMGNTEIEMPVDRALLNVGLESNATLAVWALVDPNGPTEKVVFRVFETGHEVPNGWSYLSTYQREWYTGHVFVWVGVKNEAR